MHRFSLLKKPLNMKKPLLLNIKEQFPNARERKGVPANCTYPLAYGVKKYWQDIDFTIGQQYYDSKDVFISLIEARIKEKISFIVTTEMIDLFFMYALYGRIKIEPIPPSRAPKGFINELKEDENLLMYSPAEKYRITLEPGHHILFYFVVDSTWLQRDPIEESSPNYQELIHCLQQEKEHYNSSGILPISDRIRTELLLVFTMPQFKKMLMDTMVYVPIIRLVLISQEDLQGKEKPENNKWQDTLKQIRKYYKKQISTGLAPPINEVAAHFKIGVQTLRIEYKAAYGHTLQSYITKRRMKIAAKQLRKGDKPILTIAHDLGYDLKVFQKQFKTYYQLSPSEYRELHQK